LVLMVLLNGSVPEFVVAQIPSLVPPVAVLQSPPSPIGCSLQPPAFGFALSCESMQPVAPPAQRYAAMPLTPPPLVNSETTRTSPSLWVPFHSVLPLGCEAQLAVPWRNQKPTLLLPLSLFLSSPK